MHKFVFYRPAQVPSTNVYNFGGNGYGTLPVTVDYNSNRLSFYLEFKTFLENSRLFFVGNPEVYEKNKKINKSVAGIWRCITFVIGEYFEDQVAESLQLIQKLHCDNFFLFLFLSS